MRTFGVHARQFVSHSFNLKVGAVYRDMTSSGHQYSSDPRTSSARQDTGVDFSVGKLWTFGSGFMIGADWASYTQPFWSHVSSSNGSTANFDGANYEFAKLILGFNI